MNTAKELIKHVYEGNSLNVEQSEALFDSVFSGGVTEVELSGLLMAMKTRSETAPEITGAARSMRKYASRITVETGAAIDTCGTGGDHSGSFNISTAVALIAASAGIPVAKHGNRSVSSRSGSADFLESLGIPIALTGKDAEAYFNKNKFLFMFAPNYHPAMKYAAAVRRTLGTRTIFNYLGPVTNPASPPRQIIGVFNPDFLPLYSGVVSGLGYDRVLLYSAMGGMDEVSPVKPTYVHDIQSGENTSFTIDPSDYLTTDEAFAIPSNLSAKENAALFLDTVSAKNPTPLGKLLALNAALAFCVAKNGSAIAPHYKTALDLIHSGEVFSKVKKLQEESHAC